MKLWAAVLVLSMAAAGVVFFTSTSDAVTASPTKPLSPAATMLYQIDPVKSRFMVKAGRSGLLWFKGHDHHLAIRDFSGSVELTPNVLNLASLEMTIRAASLEETSDEFTEQEKGIIKKELDDFVLETAKYPEIRFRSTSVKGGLKNGHFEIKIEGDLNLHGVTRRIEIPANVSVNGDELRATGEFSLNRKDFDVEATSAFHGLVRVKTNLKFTFDIVGHRA